MPRGGYLYTDQSFRSGRRTIPPGLYTPIIFLCGFGRLPDCLPALPFPHCAVALKPLYLCGRVRTRTVKNFCSWSIRFATVSLSGAICALSAALPHFRKNKAAAPLPLIRFCKLFRAMIRVEEIRSSARRQFTIGAFLPFSVVIYFSCLLLDRTRIHQSGGGMRASPRYSGSLGTKTCAITSAQALFSKLLNFNFETRFRFLYGAYYALAANAIQVESLSFLPSRLNCCLASGLLRGVEQTFAMFIAQSLASAFKF